MTAKEQPEAETGVERLVSRSKDPQTNDTRAELPLEQELLPGR